jgi:2-succinyl-5-enolpyruvyl-6-hydroxy-3-cyclohexene-1-carboxylate synthase
VASRGLAGIDGCVSTAAGIALAAQDSPTYALMGDLTFLHDQGGLLIGPHEPQPDLTIVVPNDDGGGIFTLLEPGEPERAADFERIFGTPTGTSLDALCRAHGARHVLACTPAELGEAVASRPTGITVIEVPLTRTAHRDLQADLRDAAVAALD